MAKRDLSDDGLGIGKKRLAAFKRETPQEYGRHTMMHGEHRSIALPQRGDPAFRARPRLHRRRVRSDGAAAAHAVACGRPAAAAITGPRFLSTADGRRSDQTILRSSKSGLPVSGFRRSSERTRRGRTRWF